MDAVTFAGEQPALERPVLVAAFQGWNDAGEAASGLLDVLGRGLDAEPVAEIDAEEFFDFQLVRPHIHNAAEGRMIDWPHNQLSAGRLLDGRSLLLFSGTEPNLRWRKFTATVVELARGFNVETAVTLGALQVDYPHTKPAPLTGSVSGPGLRTRLDLSASRYEGPTGIVGVLHQAFVAEGFPAVSMWAGVPHYLAGSVYAAAALRLGEALGELVDADLPLHELAVQAADQQREISALLDSDDDLSSYVAELDRRVSAREEGDLPAATMSGDELAAEFERYLRDRRSDG